MKKTLLLLFIITSVFAAKAQVYYVTQIAYNPFPFDSGIWVTSAVDDQWGQVLGIGFDFYYFGQAYQNLIVGTNAQLSFNTSNAGTADSWNILGPLPDSLPADTKNNIMFPWQDIDCTYKGTVKHQVYGTPPNRAFVVAFDSMPFYGSVNSVDNQYCGPSLYTGQVILYEGSNNIEMHIKDKDTCTAWNGGLAIEGIQNATGTVAYTVPGRNATQWTAHNDAWRFSPDSAFLPSPNLNRISGRVFAAVDQNCAFDSTDYPLRNKPVIFSNDSTGSQSYIFTDLEGYYSKLVDTGHYSYTTPYVGYTLYSSNCPVGGSYHVYFPDYNDSSDNNLFAEVPTQFCTLLTPGLSVTSAANYFAAINSCDTAIITLNCANNGTVADSVALFLTMNSSIQILSSSMPYTLTNGTYGFLVGYLNPGFDSTITMLVKMGCDTNGTQYCFTATAQGLDSTVCTGNSNTDNLCGFLGSPFDPNAMYVSSVTHPEKGIVNYLETTDSDTLDYLVTFQNTGTGPAHNVELRIPLSVRIDTASLMPLIASYNYSWLVLAKTLIVDFTGINLPDTAVSHSASEGYFKFRVKQAAGNMPGDSIIHLAQIYFDQNAPVVTNNTVVKIASTDTVTTNILNEGQAGVRLYPNPSNSGVMVVTPEISKIRVTDATGREVYAQQLTSISAGFDVSKWANGVYLVTISSDKRSTVFKFIKD